MRSVFVLEEDSNNFGSFHHKLLETMVVSHNLVSLYDLRLGVGECVIVIGEIFIHLLFIFNLLWLILIKNNVLFDAKDERSNGAALSGG